MMTRASIVMGLLLLASAFGQVPGRLLQITFVDVEGGGATLIVTPAGESVLLDAGWAGVGGRDARRIKAAMDRAGVSAINHLITSHYHMDHYGGVPDLVALVPVERFYDHGPMREMTEDPDFATRFAAYQAAARNRTTTVRPGDRIALRAIEGAPAMWLTIVAAKGQVAQATGPANLHCDATPAASDTTENGRSVAVRLAWGAFDFLNLADLTAPVSRQLICPANAVGAVDLYQATHHGGNAANYPALIKSLAPTVAVMINGPQKGGHPDTVRHLFALPSPAAVYQLHRNVQADPAAGLSAGFIANLDATPDAAHDITVSVDLVRSTFTVTNGRTGDRQTYPIR